MKDYKVSALNNFLKKRQKNLSITSDLKYQLLRIKNNTIFAKLAQTDQELAEGLMYVSELDKNQGCLLSFPQEQFARIWMKNCKMNLSAAMIDNKGIIIKIAKMSYTDPYYIHHSPSMIKYVLEMSEDFFDKNNIKVGDKVSLLPY